MSNLVQDIRYAARTLLKSPGFTAIAVITLALGIGANSSIFSLVNAVLLRPLPYSDADGLVRFVDIEPGRQLNLSYPNVLDWRARSKSFSDMAVYNAYATRTLTGVGPAEVLPAASTEGRLFTMLGAQPVAGRLFIEEDHRPGAEPVVVLSHKLWDRKFGRDSKVIGRSITLDGAPHTVVGVLPPWFRLTGAEVWWTLGPRMTQNMLDRGNHGGFAALGRLKAGISLAQAQSEMSQIAKALENEHPITNRNLSVGLVPLRESMVGRFQVTLIALLIAVNLVLLIACGNVAGLLLARSVGRQREVAIQLALGAGRGQLIRQFLCESLLLAVMGGAGGMLLAMWGVDALQKVWRVVPPAGSIAVDQTVMIYSAGLTLLTAVLFGMAPALSAARGNLLEVLKQQSGGTSSARPQRLRRALVAIEVALSVALVVGAGVMIRSLHNLSRVDAGFEADKLLAIEMREPPQFHAGARAQQLHEQIRERLRDLPGVEAIATSWPFSYSTFSWTPRINLYGKPFPDGAEPMVETSAVTPEYFRTMGIPLRVGRGIESSDRAGTRRVAVVSEEFVRQFWPEQNPIGQRVKLVGIPELDDLEIVGVVGSTRRAGPARRAYPEIYCAMAQFPQSGSTIVVRAAGDPLQIAPQIRQRIAQVNPDVAIVRTQRLQDAMAEAVSDRSLVQLVLSLFAGLALTLTAVGIYGVVAFAVESRTREIGVRVALGASSSAIRRMVLRQGLLPVVFGIAIGTCIAAAMAQLLTKLVYGVSPYDPATLAISGLTLLIVGALACYLPARRATRVDPMVALRYE